MCILLQRRWEICVRRRKPDVGSSECIEPHQNWCNNSHCSGLLCMKSEISSNSKGKEHTAAEAIVSPINREASRSPSIFVPSSSRNAPSFHTSDKDDWVLCVSNQTIKVIPSPAVVKQTMKVGRSSFKLRPCLIPESS